VSSNIKQHLAQTAAGAARADHPPPAVKRGTTPPAALMHEARTAGISRGLLVAVGIALVGPGRGHRDHPGHPRRPVGHQAMPELSPAADRAAQHERHSSRPSVIPGSG